MALMRHAQDLYGIVVCALVAMFAGTMAGQATNAQPPSASARACTFDFERPDLPDCVLMKESGRLLVSSKYVRDLPFDSRGLAAVWVEGLGWSYANRVGELVITGVVGMDNGADTFHSGLVRVVRNRKYGFANRRGTIVIPAEYDGALNFEKGTAVVCRNCRTETDGEHSWFSGGQWFRINTRGQVIENLKSDHLSGKR